MQRLGYFTSTKPLSTGGQGSPHGFGPNVGVHDPVAEQIKVIWRQDPGNICDGNDLHFFLLFVLVEKLSMFL